MVRLPCGSRSTSSTRIAGLGQAGGEIDAGRGLPDPPFWLVMARMGSCALDHDKMPLRPVGNGEGVAPASLGGGRQALDLLEGMNLHRGERAARCKQMTCQREELGNFGERAEMMQSKFSAACQVSTRSHTTVASSTEVRYACLRKPLFCELLSSNVT